MQTTRRTSAFPRSRLDRPERAGPKGGWGLALCALLAGCDLVAEADAGPRAAAAISPSSAARADATRAVSPRIQRAEPAGPASGCPKEMARVADVCVDRWEAHLVVEAGGAFTPHPAHARPTGPARYAARSEPGVLPQAYVSRVEAASACENAGKRLCSLLEWFEACRGSRQTVYPYGKKYEPKRCNVGKPHLLSRFFGTNARAWRYDEHFNDPRLDQIPGFLAKTGEYAGCVSDYGVADMVGNLHEWVADRADASLAEKLPLKDGIRRALGRNTGKGIFMGGFFSTTSEHGRGCTFVTAAHEPKYHDYSTGFRCCAAPSP